MPSSQPTPTDSPEEFVPLIAAPGAPEASLPSRSITETRTAAEVLLRRPGKAAEAFAMHGVRAQLVAGIVPSDAPDHQLFEAFCLADEPKQEQLLQAIMDRPSFSAQFYAGMLSYCRNLVLAERLVRKVMENRPSGFSSRLAAEMMASCPRGTTPHRLLGAVLLEQADTPVEIAAQIFEMYPTNDRILIATWGYCRRRHYGPAECDDFARKVTNRAAMNTIAVLFDQEYREVPSVALIEEFERRVRAGNMTPGRVHAILQNLAARDDVSFEDLWEVLSRMGRDIPTDYLQAAFGRPERQAQLRKALES